MSSHRAAHRRPGSGRPAGHVVAAAATAVALALVAGVLATGALSGRDRPSSARSGAPPSAAVPSATATTTPSTAVRAALVRALARRTVPGHARSAAFGPALPVRRYRVTLLPGAPVPADAATRARLTLPVVERFALVGDPATVQRSADATLVRHGGTWSLDAVDPDHPDLWDRGPVAVARGRRALVVGAAGGGAVLAQVAATADAAVAAVTDVWGAGWSRRAVVELPASVPAMARLLGRSAASLTGLAGVTTAVTGVGRAPVVRIVLNPRAYRRLGPLGRSIVLRHEVTHVAQDWVRIGGAPLWLVEGLADYVGYRGTGLPVSVVAPALVAAARAGWRPAALPADSAFRRGGAVRERAYESGWWLAALLARRYGEPALVRVYRAAVHGNAPAARRLDVALARAVHLDRARLLALWRTELAGTA